MIQTLAADHTTATVIPALQAEGIRPVLLKGPSMARWLYPTGGRHYVDCDLLVSPQDRMGAEAVLRRLGYQESLAKARNVERERHSMPWHKPGQAVSVDLHYTLPGARQANANVWQVLSNNTESFELGSITFDVLNANARALHVALHAAEDGIGNSQVREDLRRALATTPWAGWEKAAALAASIGAGASFGAGLRLLPDGRETAAGLNLSDSPPAEVVLRAAGHPSTAIGISQVAAAGSVTRGFSILMSKVFPTTTFMRRWYPAARRPLGLPVAYIQRWIWIARHAPGGYRAWRMAAQGNSKMKIVLYSWPFAPTIGGLERLTEITAARLVDAGQEVTVATGTPDDGGVSPSFPFAVKRNLGVAGYYRLVKRADVVLLYTFSLKLVAAALVARTPVVWQHIDFDTVSPRGICHRRGYPCRGRWGECYRCLREDHSQKSSLRALLSLAVKRIAKSMVAMNLISTPYAATQMSLPRVEMISFGIDTEHFSVPGKRQSGEDLQILFCARHIPGKGCDVLIRALAKCRQNGMKFSAVIAGDGPHRQASIRLAGKLGVTDRVTFTGHISDEELLAEMRRADVVAVPTLQHEIGQLVAYEAMSCECCVAISRIGAFPEQLEGAVEFFPPGDDAELAKILSELAGDPERRQRLATAGRARIVEQFELDLMCRRYIDLLSQATHRRVS